MKQSVGRILVETSVRKTLREIRLDPMRTIRNRIDLAKEFSQGDYQPLFFEEAGRLLEKEDSAYYSLVQKTIETFDPDRLVTLGMNIGYNGCIHGAQRIRSLESREHFNIPWCISLNIDTRSLPSLFQRFCGLIEEGINLGIYCWQLHVEQLSEELLDLIGRFPDCAFLLFFPAAEYEPIHSLKTDTLPHVLFIPSVRSSENLQLLEPACLLLQKKRIPYGILLFYNETGFLSLTREPILQQLMNLSPILTFFASETILAPEQAGLVYSRITGLRRECRCPTVFLELMEDNYRIDRIISSENCSAGFTEDGQLFTRTGVTEGSKRNYRHCSLKEILKTAFPKAPDSSPF